MKSCIFSCTVETAEVSLVELPLIVVSMRLLVQTHLGFLAYVSTHPSGFVLYKNEDVFMSIVFTTNYIGLKFVRVIVICNYEFW